MNLPELRNLIVEQCQILGKNKVKMGLDPETETANLLFCEWWTEEMNIKLKVREIDKEGREMNNISSKPTLSHQQCLSRIWNALGIPADTPLSKDFLMYSFNILVWNCRGAGNDRFRNNFKEIVKSYKPDVVALLETKVDFKSTGMFFKNLGFSASVTVDPVGRAGGIWLLWDTSNVSLSVISLNPQVIHATVKKDNFEDWVFSSVYASPNPRNRDMLWEDLESQADNMGKWCIAGDFNDTMSLDESKSSAQDSNANQRRKLGDRINNCQLLDMGFSGPKFTWTNGRQGRANTKKRLDRAMCNADWRALFPDV